MHPDEDWAETFAVWLTPGRNWKSEYASWPQALEKLNYVDAKMAELRDLDPLLTEGDADDDVGDLTFTVEQFYASSTFVRRNNSSRARRFATTHVRRSG